MRISTLLICAAILALAGCGSGSSEPPPTPEEIQTDGYKRAKKRTDELVFTRHPSTNLCVASRGWGSEHGVAFDVPCTPEVLAIIQNQTVTEVEITR